MTKLDPRSLPAGTTLADVTQSRSDILAEFVVPERKARIDEVLAQRTSGLTVVLDQVRNFHNISAVIRSADAFGISRVHLVSEQIELSTGISLGAERWVQLSRHATPADAVSQLKADGFRLVMLQPEHDERGTNHSRIPSVCITDLPFEEKLALVFGNEVSGVSPEFASAVDMHAFIPMFGFVESLNISVACAITLFCSTLGSVSRERRTIPLGADERLMLKEAWLRKSVRNADLIVREVERRASDRPTGCADKANEPPTVK